MTHNPRDYSRSIRGASIRSQSQLCTPELKSMFAEKLLWTLQADGPAVNHVLETKRERQRQRERIRLAQSWLYARWWRRRRKSIRWAMYVPIPSHPVHLTVPWGHNLLDAKGTPSAYVPGGADLDGDFRIGAAEQTDKRGTHTRALLTTIRAALG